MEEVIKHKFLFLLKKHKLDNRVSNALNAYESEPGYISDSIVLNAEKAIQIYGMRVHTSNLPHEEIEELRSILDKLNRVADKQVRIVTIMKDKWLEEKGTAYLFFTDMNLDVLYGLVTNPE